MLQQNNVKEPVQVPVYMVVILMLVVTTIGVIVGFSFGSGSAVHEYILNNCTHYPFLLLDPNTHIACLLP